MHAGDAGRLDALDQSCVPEVRLARGGAQREMSQLWVLHFQPIFSQFYTTILSCRGGSFLRQ